MDLQLQGLRVFVSAGASGIGLAIVESFLAEGAHIATCDVDKTALLRWPKNTRACIAIYVMFPIVRLFRKLSMRQQLKWAGWIVWSIMPASLALPQKLKILMMRHGKIVWIFA